MVETATRQVDADAASPRLLLLDALDKSPLVSMLSGTYAVTHVTALGAALAFFTRLSFDAVVVVVNMRTASSEWAANLGRITGAAPSPVVVWSDLDDVEHGPLNALILQAGADEAVHRGGADAPDRLMRALVRCRARASRDERSVPRQMGAMTEALTRMAAAQERTATTLSAFMEQSQARMTSLENAFAAAQERAEAAQHRAESRTLGDVWRSLPVSARAIVSAVVMTSLFAFFVIIATPALILATQNGLDLSMFLPLVLPKP